MPEPEAVGVSRACIPQAPVPATDKAWTREAGGIARRYVCDEGRSDFVALLHQDHYSFQVSAGTNV